MVKPARSIAGYPIAAACLAEYGIGELAKRIWARANEKTPGSFKGVEPPKT